MVVKDYFGSDVNVSAYRSSYRNNGNLAVLLETYEGEPWATLTVNLPDYGKLPEDYAFVDTNNCPWAEEFIRKYKLGEPTGQYGHSGYCDYPLYIFDPTKLGDRI
jgi:hypothetical protein